MFNYQLGACLGFYSTYLVFLTDPCLHVLTGTPNFMGNFVGATMGILQGCKVAARASVCTQSALGLGLEPDRIMAN